MSSTESGFKFLERGFKKNLILIPGWATDYRIFNTLDLDYNYFLPLRLSPFNFTRELFNLLGQTYQEKVSVLGYSLGGFLACDFASRYPEAVDELIILSIRKNYDAGILKEIKRKIKLSKCAYLYKFYHNCFSAEDKEGLDWFRKNLLDDYLKEITLDSLLSGLDYLSRATIKPQGLNRIRRIRIFHGAQDIIAPPGEAVKIKSDLAQAEFKLVDNRGHLLFLHPGFKENFYHG